METVANDVFDGARRIVAEHDRRIAEEEQRVRDAERETMLRGFAQHVDAAFDFTSREKLELDPRMDVLEGRGVLEFVVRSHHAIFLLSEGSNGKWGLQAAEDDLPLQLLMEVEGGTHTDANSRRLAAARVVMAIGDWVGAREASAPRPELVPAPAKVAAAPQPVPQRQPKVLNSLPPINSLPPVNSVQDVDDVEQDEEEAEFKRPAPPVPHFGKTFGY